MVSAQADSGKYRRHCSDHPPPHFLIQLLHSGQNDRCCDAAVACSKQELDRRRVAISRG